MKLLKFLIVITLILPVLTGCKNDSFPIEPDDISIDLRDNSVDIIELYGVQPEGIVVGKGNTGYVGGFLLGSILEVNLKTGAVETLVEGTPGLFTIGLSFDDRSNFIYAAGGATGAVKVYNANTGAMEGYYQLVIPTDPLSVWINDLVVTRNAVYVTNSLSPTLYKIPLGPGGELPGMDEVEEIPLVGEWVQETEVSPGLPVAINANGIDATPNGKWLLVANFAGNLIYKVDPLTGYAEMIEIDAPIMAPDGIKLEPRITNQDGYDLYIVHAPNTVTKVRLDKFLEFESVLDVITSPDLQSPTTIDIKGDDMFVVNARFDMYDPFMPHPDAVFSVVRMDK